MSVHLLHSVPAKAKRGCQIPRIGNLQEVISCYVTTESPALYNSHKYIKYLGVTKQVKDLFDKNFKSLKKEIEEDVRK